MNAYGSMAWANNGSTRVLETVLIVLCVGVFVVGLMCLVVVFVGFVVAAGS